MKNNILKLFKTITVINDSNIFLNYIVGEDLDTAYDQMREVPGSTHITETNANEEFKELEYLRNRLCKCKEDIEVNMCLNLPYILPSSENED